MSENSRDPHQPPPSEGPTRRTVLTALGGATALGVATTAGLVGAADAATERRIDTLLARMTLAEKLGQLQLVNTADLARAGLAKGAVGGLFSVTDSAVLDDVQHQAVHGTRLGIP